MTRIKIFCVTKNEYDLIEHFIVYYGYLFGYNNLIIIDNNSTHETVLSLYDKYIKLGITVVYEPNYTGNGQADMFNKYMSLEKSKCDFLIGLDTDEFLFSYDDFTKGNDPCCKENILKIFQSYSVDSTSFKISSYPCSIIDKSNTKYMDNKFINPAAEIVYFSHDTPVTEKVNQFWKDISKYFVRSNSFVSTTCGNHKVVTSYGNSVDSSLGLFHFNNTGKRRVFERAKTVVDGYNYFSTSQDISAQIDTLVLHDSMYILGFHKVRDYYAVLLKTFILDLFIKYIKRVPIQSELDWHSYNNISVKSCDIENKFKHCEEAILNKDTTFIFNDEHEKNNIIFYDESLDEVSSKYKVFKNTYLHDFFKRNI